MIPQGLKSKRSPSVPKINTLHHTQEKMEGYFKQDILHLTLLKRYYQDAITTLINKINNLEARLCRNSGFVENQEGIQGNKERLTTIYDKRKTNKLSKVIENKPRKTRRYCRKKRSQENSDIDKGNSNINTVVNISNVSFSVSERSLLLKVLSFCPKPSRIDMF